MIGKKKRKWGPGERGVVNWGGKGRKEKGGVAIQFR